MGYAFFGVGDEPLLITGIRLKSAYSRAEIWLLIAMSGVLEAGAGLRETGASGPSRPCVWTTWDMGYDERA
jgi:hypothetical protein